MTVIYVFLSAPACVSVWLFSRVCLGLFRTRSFCLGVWRVWTYFVSCFFHICLQRLMVLGKARAIRLLRSSRGRTAPALEAHRTDEWDVSHVRVELSRRSGNCKRSYRWNEACSRVHKDRGRQPQYSQIAELVSRTAVVLILIRTSSSLFAVRPAHFTCHHGVRFRVWFKSFLQC